jgi:hypothetical protein
MIRERNPDGFDIIIDDGPHTLESQIYAVKNYLYLLKPGGILFIEDVYKMEWFQSLILSIPEELKDNLEVIEYDLRGYKNRPDDLLLLIRRKN